jgi:hypothetical protein
VSFDEADSEGTTELAGGGEISQRVAALEREMTKLHRIVMDLRSDMRKTRGDD